MTPGYQSVQSGHAVADFIMQHPTEASHWHQTSNYLIYLSVKDESDLKSLSKKLQDIGILVTEFEEPDIDNAVTAIAFISEEKTKKLTSGLPLQLKEIK